MSHATLCFLSFQRPKFLASAVRTALDGCDEPVELIIHDDGSTDPELLEMLYDWHRAGRLSSLILNAPGVNQGQGIALNRMFRMASGDPIIKLDQDLIFHSGWLSRVRAILEDERVGLLGLFKYDHEPVDWRETIISDERLRRGDWGKQVARPPMEDVPVGYSFHTHICGSGFAVPRRVWERIGPFAERWESFGEDWDFQRRVHRHPCWFNALPDEDLVRNQGFGIGPSTVVVAPGRPREIYKLPGLVGRQPDDQRARCACGALDSPNHRAVCWQAPR